jgi:aspartyl-tRNA(Asn)/glutamyl-tRNA(Gln) amidotransferase subunit C
MPPPLSRNQIDHVAALASLSLQDAEAEALATELDSILRYVAELDAVDTTGVPPTSSIQDAATSWRTDEVTPGISHEEALEQAPRTAHGGFAVPAFVEAPGGGARR